MKQAINNQSNKAPLEPYCLNGHKRQCYNPPQCYCSCHSIEAMTDSELNKIIEHHEVQAEKYRKVIRGRHE